METTTEYFETMETLWNTFVTEHNATTAVSKARARKTIGEMKKLVTGYRLASNNEVKAAKEAKKNK